MACLKEGDFNPAEPTVVHIDFNSCFATVEQQANPFLRGKPVAVAAYSTPSGCIVAPSVEAKEHGVRVGMRVTEGKRICPDLYVLEPDPSKYRAVHRRLKKLLLEYCDRVVPRSIDEFVFDLDGYPACDQGIQSTAQEIKDRIRQEIGEWLRVSIGIGTSRFMAKLAAGLDKPDGLRVIDKDNFITIFFGLELTDLCGVNRAYEARLKDKKIYTVLDFYTASLDKLKSAFLSIHASHWYLKLRGWEVNDFDFCRKSFGNSVALGKPLNTYYELAPVITKLIDKCVRRMRQTGYRARGVGFKLSYRDGTHASKRLSSRRLFCETREVYDELKEMIVREHTDKPVRKVAVFCFDLVPDTVTQLDLFNQFQESETVARTVDEINDRWGEFTLVPARMLGTRGLV